MKLTGKQIRFLRALGHHLDPVVQLGKNGLTDQATHALDEALTRHELIKLRIGTECPEGKAEIAERVPAALSATVAQALGRTLLIYRRNPKKPVIKLPTTDDAKKAKREAEKKARLAAKGVPAKAVPAKGTD